jgi:hypothetical protein
LKLSAENSALKLISVHWVVGTDHPEWAARQNSSSPAPIKIQQIDWGIQACFSRLRVEPRLAGVSPHLAKRRLNWFFQVPGDALVNFKTAEHINKYVDRWQQPFYRQPARLLCGSG